MRVTEYTVTACAALPPMTLALASDLHGKSHGETLSLLRNASPDLILINRRDKATIGVDVIRALREDVHHFPNDGDKKVYVIEEAVILSASSMT